MTADRPFKNLWWFRGAVAGHGATIALALVATYAAADLRGTAIRLLGDLTTALATREHAVAGIDLHTVTGRAVAALGWSVWDQRNRVLGLIAVLLVAAALVSLWRDLVRMRTASDAKQTLRAALLDAFAREPARTRRDRGAGAMIEVYRSDVDVVATHIAFGAAGVVENAVQLVVYGALLVQAMGGAGGWRLLGAFVLLSLIGQMVSLRAVARRERDALTRAHETQRSAMSVTMRVFEVFRELVYLGADRRVGRSVTDRWADVDTASRRVRTWTGVSAVIGEAAQQLTLPIILLAVATTTPGSVGNVIGATLLFAQIAGPLAALLAYPRALRQVAPSLQQLRGAIGSLHRSSAPDARPAASAASVRLSGVSVRFAGAATCALNDVTLEIAAGERVAIVGRSGSGKTTLARVIAGDEPIEAGSVWIDEHDVTTQPVVSRRELVAFVPSPPGFLLDTIRANIELGRAVPRDVFDSSARAALADVAAARQPDGFETVMTPETSLSVGEQRRIALARGLCSPQPVLVLDEPTAQLDREMLGEVVAGVLAVTRGRTCVFVTNDPELAAACDAVFLVENGEVRPVVSALAEARS